MSSIEQREVKGRTSYRVRYRHQGKNLAVTFATRDGAEKWQHTLDMLGHDSAREVVIQTPPDLTSFGDAIVPRPGPHLDPFGAYVYLLWGTDRTRPVYVGATTNLHRRIGQHVREKGAYFLTFSVIRCRDEQTMWRVEEKMIRHYRPELNLMSGRAS